MKRYIVFIFFLIGSFSYSQDVEALTMKNGFKHYVFGQSALEYKDIELTKQDGRQTQYTYIGKDITSLFGFDVAIIDFIFLDDKLYNVLIFYQNLSINSFTIVKQELEDNYGISSLGYNAIEMDFSHSCQWRSSTILMELSRYESGVSYISITEMNIFKLLYKDKL